MTAMVDLDVAMSRSRTEVAAQDMWRDHNEKHASVLRLTSIGLSAREIADAVGISERHVVRLRSQPLRSDVPHLPDPRDITDRRADEFDLLARKAFEWAGVLRDEDPVIVWEALSRLSRQRLQELVVVALAMVPSEATLREVLAWVIELGEAGEPS